MSSSVANAQHLQKMHLHLGESDCQLQQLHLDLEESDINFLQSILSSLTSSQSLQELVVTCDGASGVFSECADSVRAYIHVHVGNVWYSV